MGDVYEYFKGVETLYQVDTRLALGDLPILREFEVESISAKQLRLKQPPDMGGFLRLRHDLKAAYLRGFRKTPEEAWERATKACEKKLVHINQEAQNTENILVYCWEELKKIQKGKK